MSLLTSINFGVPSLIFGPLVAKYLAENGVSGTFKKKLLAQFISYLAFTLMGWVSWPLYIFMFLASFGPSGGQIFGWKWVSRIFLKNYSSIYYIPGLYPKGVSLMTPIHFGVPSLIFGPWVAKYLAEKRVSGNFWKKTYWLNSFQFWNFLKNCWLNSFHSWHLPLWGESLDPYTFSCS